MKKNKIITLGLSITLIVAMAGCTPRSTNMRNMSTQTRLYGNNANTRRMNNAPFNTRDRLNTNLNNGMVRDNTYLNDGVVRDNIYSNDGVVRDNTYLDNGVVRDRTNLDSARITNDVNHLSTRAQAIEKRISALPEINAASVVIHGDTALVGLERTTGTTGTKGTTTHEITPAIKQKVEAAVKTADKNIKKVSVTSEPTLYTRIRTMSTNISAGHPIANFTRDIEDILRRITAPIR